MKKFLFLFLSSCAFPQAMPAQNYTPFPEDIAVWDVYERPSEPDPRLTAFHRYTMDGDTIINGKSYNKIYCSRWAWTYPPSELNMTRLGYCFGIRQDITNKKVYRTITINNSTVDTLLYDFDLKVGDIIPPTAATRPGAPAQIVSSIDTVVYSEKKYKRLNLKGGLDGAALIEGVGNANGLIEYTDGFFEAADVLNAFCNSTTSDCKDLLALTIQRVNAKNQVRTYPNPFTDKLTIIFDDETIKWDVVISDVLGKEIQRFNQVSKQLTVDRNEMKNGVYFLKFSDKDEAFVKKIIVQ